MPVLPTAISINHKLHRCNIHPHPYPHPHHNPHPYPHHNPHP